MNTNWRHNIPLIVGLAIPVVMVIAIFLTIYIPRTLVKPQTNFVYAVGTYPNYIDATKTPAEQHAYQVVDSQLQETVTPMTKDETDNYPPYYQKEEPPTFHLYDVRQQRSQELSLKDIQQLHLDRNASSTDGFQVKPAGSNGSIFDLFGSSGGRNDWFLVGHNASFKLNIPTVNTEPYSYYGYDQGFHFIGWVK